MREPWEVMFEKLIAYKNENGHCDVPAHRDKLGRWVERQRTLRRLGKLHEGREAALESIGFRWKIQKQTKPRNKISTDTFDERFDKMVGQVVLFVEQHGCGWIPQSHQDRELAIWSKNRRKEKKQGTLSEERKKALDKAGFVWEFRRKRAC